MVITLVADLLGRFSYHFYWLFVFLLALPITMLAAKLSYMFLESPFLRLKRRFEILRTRPV